MPTYNIKVVDDPKYIDDVLGVILEVQEDTPYKNVFFDIDRFKSNLSHWIANVGSPYVILICEEVSTQNVVGVLIFSIHDTSPLLPGVPVSTEMAMFVLREHRNNSCGGRLKKAFEQMSIDNGAKYISMGAMPNEYEDRLHSAYTKSGYKLVEKIYIKEVE